MNPQIVNTFEPITIVGGGAADAKALSEAMAHAPRLVAADGGAETCWAAGHMPEAVIGDLDSISRETLSRFSPGTIHHIAEQDSTDFDKALRSVSSPLVIGVGFLGARVDHTLAALSRLVARCDRRVILIGETDVIFHAPPAIDLPLNVGARVSLFPMAALHGSSRGLRWPIDGIEMAPDDRVGTSNEATGPVSLRFDRPGMLILLERQFLSLSVASLLRVAPWPARA